VIYAAVLAGLGFLVGLFDWRRGLLLCLAVGFLQDPLRKITPGQPVAFVVLVGVVFVGCAAGFLLKRGSAGVSEFLAWYPGLRLPLALFVLVVALQSVATIVRTGNPVLAGIGVLSYASPLVALVLGHAFARTARDIGRWQKVYLAGALAVGATVLLAFQGFRSPLFASIGADVVFGRGGGVRMVSGLMRSSEIAAWHVSIGACLVVIWAIAHRKARTTWIGSALVLGLLLAVVVTGRRKTLGMMLIFLVVFGFLLVRWRRGATRILRAMVAVGVTAGALVLLRSGEGLEARWNPYFERSFSVITDAPERLWEMTYLTLKYVVQRNGVLGAGAGTGAQGAQYFGGGVTLVGGSAEGGLGRVTAELGLPGLAVVLWLAFAILVRLWRLARRLPEAAPQHAVRFLGLLALLPANGVVFLTAHQTFGDPFVLIVVGFVASSALAYPQIVTRERHALAVAREIATAPRAATAGAAGEPLPA
jgi:hypothetical protein